MKLKYLILLAITGTIVSLDQFTKYLVLQNFNLGESISIIEGFFNLTYVRNSGAAFGILRDANPAFRIPFFIFVPILALAITLYIFRKSSDQELLLSIALSLVMGGAVGNLIDRALYNYVVDFLDFHWKYLVHFPAFNIADSAICVGVGLLFIDMIKKEKNRKS